jgi:hypothetical protein
MDRATTGPSVAKRLLPLLSLGVILVLAGCSAGSFGGSAEQERPVTVIVNNSANVTQSFEISVVEFLANATVRRNDGRTETFPIGRTNGSASLGRELRSHSPGENNTYTSVELPGSTRVLGRYALDPGEGMQRSVDDVSRDDAVVIIVYEGDDIVWWVSTYCTGEFGGVRVKTLPNHDSGITAYTCQ